MAFSAACDAGNCDDCRWVQCKCSCHRGKRKAKPHGNIHIRPDEVFDPSVRFIQKGGLIYGMGPRPFAEPT